MVICKSKKSDQLKRLHIIHRSTIDGQQFWEASEKINKTIINYNNVDDTANELQDKRDNSAIIDQQPTTVNDCNYPELKNNLDDDSSMS